VRDLLKLDREFYSSDDDGLLREAVSRLKIAGRQVLLRPTLLRDAIVTLSLKALYLPDRKRILLDSNLPAIKHRWNEAHEIGHDIIPWHADMMLGDTEQTLTPGCHEQIEAEANYAAGRILFLAETFEEQANSSPPSLAEVRRLSKLFGNTITSTLWRYIEQTHTDQPLVALVTGHPHRTKRKADFDPKSPCRYFIRSPAFAQKFGHLVETDLFDVVVSYCGAQKGGPLGTNEIVLQDHDSVDHIFQFETFFNGHEALTLGSWSRVKALVVPVPIG
jgi:hypothetical protein